MKSGQVGEKGKARRKERGRKRNGNTEGCWNTNKWLGLNFSVIVVFIPQGAGVGYIYRSNTY
jgi:hypothetical protein